MTVAKNSPEADTSGLFLTLLLIACSMSISYFMCLSLSFHTYKIRRMEPISCWEEGCDKVS